MKVTEAQPDIIREFFLEANPNPERIGCPPEDTLRRAGENRLPVDDPARLHLAKCSECFAEYRGYRLDWEAHQSRRRVIGWAVAAALLLAVGGGAIAIHERHLRQPDEQIAQVSTPQGAPYGSDAAHQKPQSPAVTPSPPKVDGPDLTLGKHQPHDANGGLTGRDPTRPHGFGPAVPPRSPDTPAPASPAPVGTVTLPLGEIPTVDEEPTRGRGEPLKLSATTSDLIIVDPKLDRAGQYRVVISKTASGNDEVAQGVAKMSTDKPVLNVVLPLDGVKPGRYYLIIEGADGRREAYRLLIRELIPKV